ncbi:MAG: enoyl-CoA hydratase-related protein [Legionellales bacterium]|nr:enoyl-CoA hydratase-related protein [Legionellales bacterium]
MRKILSEQIEHVGIITLHNGEKHNAFDDELIRQLDHALDEAIQHPDIRIIVLQANGRHFSAGADLAWMQRMVDMSENDNQADALKFAQTIHKLYECPKPTIALVQGATYGGGIGLIAACDIAFATEQAKFCFSEVTLGLIPAVISPYVIQAIGPRMAKALFLSAEVFYAPQAQAMHLIHTLVPEAELHTAGLAHAKALSHMPNQALCQAKALVRHVQDRPIDTELIQHTAQWIAQIRVSMEAQNALHLFLNRSQG